MKYTDLWYTYIYIHTQAYTNVTPSLKNMHIYCSSTLTFEGFGLEITVWLVGKLTSCPTCHFLTQLFSTSILIDKSKCCSLKYKHTYTVHTLTNFSYLYLYTQRSFQKQIHMHSHIHPYHFLTWYSYVYLHLPLWAHGICLHVLIFLHNLGLKVPVWFSG